FCLRQLSLASGFHSAGYVPIALPCGFPDSFSSLCELVPVAITTLEDHLFFPFLDSVIDSLSFAARVLSCLRCISDHFSGLSRRHCLTRQITEQNPACLRRV